MDISQLDQGAWLEAESADKNLPILKLKIKFMEVLEADEFANFLLRDEGEEKEGELSEEQRKEIATKEVEKFNQAIERLSAYILDWDLTSGSDKIPCDDENKKKYLPKLLRFVVKKQGDNENKKDEYQILVMEVLAFAQKVENFLKN